MRSWPADVDIYLLFSPINCRCFNAFTLWSDFHGKFASLEGALYEQRNQALVYKVTVFGKVCSRSFILSFDIFIR